MPSKYNSEQTKNTAKSIADALGINYDVLPIENIHKISKLCLDIKDEELADENLQAKIRSTIILSTLTQHMAHRNHGAIFVNCANKTEIFLGYGTLYGDWGGAISPLGDVLKYEVYEMGRYINKTIFGKNVIPGNLFPDYLYQYLAGQIEPSAELKNNQVDPIKVGYDCALIEAMMDYRKKSPEQILQWWLDGTLHDNLGIKLALLQRYRMGDAEEFVEDLFWLCKTNRAQVFKRIQSVPIIVLSKTAFGYDLRESMMPEFQWSPKAKELIEKIEKQDEYMS